MPEDGFSSFEIQTPMENLAPCKPKGTPWILQILKSTAVVYTSKIDMPITHGGGVGAMPVTPSKTLGGSKIKVDWNVFETFSDIKVDCGGLQRTKVHTKIIGTW